MQQFEEKKFAIPALKGISAKTIEEHLKLYAGYVKNANSILTKIPEYEGYASQDAFAPYAANEIRRRFAFEFGGMRNHEIYFGSLEGGPMPLSPENPLAKIDWENFKQMAMTRGVGWAMLGFDTSSKQLIQYWVDEQHLGHLPGVSPVLALDMWEHSYVADYQPSGKKQYVEDFFANVNWQKVEENFAKAHA
jgi:Fe-Mn family superoxide dismutase